MVRALINITFLKILHKTITNYEDKKTKVFVFFLSIKQGQTVNKSKVIDNKGKSKTAK